MLARLCCLVLYTFQDGTQFIFDSRHASKVEFDEESVQINTFIFNDDDYWEPYRTYTKTMGKNAASE